MTMTQQRPESKELSILIKLLKMTTSTHDQEALSAMRLANMQLLKLGTDWEDLLNGKVTLIADPFTSVPDLPQQAPAATPFHRPQTPPRPTAPPQPPPQPIPMRDATLVQPRLDAFMFVTVPPSVTIRINRIEQAWLQNKQLSPGDWSELRGLSDSYAPLKTKRKRRTTP